MHGWAARENFVALAEAGYAELAGWLKSRKHLEVARELAWEVTVGGEVLVGALDRLERDPSTGLWTVVDFKITQSMTPKLAELYEVQMRLYAWATGVLQPESKDRVAAQILAVRPGAILEVPVELTATWQELDHWVRGLCQKAVAALQGHHYA